MTRTRGLAAVPERPERRGRGRPVGSTTKKPADQPKRPPAKRTPMAKSKAPIVLDETERESLLFLRSHLRSEIDKATGQALASLIRQFREVDKDIRAIDAMAAREAEEAEEPGDADWDDDEI